MSNYSQEADYDAFKQQLPDLLRTSKGKFVVMHNRTVQKISDNQDEALKFAVREYGMGNFIVQEIHNRRVRPLSYSLAI